MSSPRSKRLAGPTSLLADGASVLLYECPAGKVALVKSVRVVNGSSVGVGLELGLEGTTASQLVWKGTVAAGSTFVDPDTDPIVLAAGEAIYGQGQAVAPFTDAVTVTLSGAELTA